MIDDTDQTGESPETNTRARIHGLPDYMPTPQEKALIEAQAQEILKALGEQESATDFTGDPHLARDLVDALRSSLVYDPDKDDIELVLRRQAVALDTAFRRLLSNADTRNCDHSQYGMAFRAQYQFRQTLESMRVMEKAKKTERTNCRTGHNDE